MMRASTQRPSGKHVVNTAGSEARPMPLSVDEASRGLVVRSFRVAPPDVVFVKSVLEASEGIACIFAESGGELCIASPVGREVELGVLLTDLARELSAELGPASFRVAAHVSAGGVDA